MNWINKQYLDFEKEYNDKLMLRLLKNRRSGFARSMDYEYTAEHRERQSCIHYLEELSRYVEIGYKKPFTEKEYNDLNQFIQSDDLNTILLAKQIILNKLNYDN